ncbi:class I SAM-dependent methyltransferase [Caldibacillus lycopersici]|uniref:Uncharacterized methyltransferase OEV98_08400 n=1 Tax=Perspicuibacillus lycopersici TaxID=1325689 RepID=A0AAE3IU07_9BACI|nr:class I SAM-dependent methyltransferase [Perspicuibacillus lycopersici]MCU9613578.1 class I SAM-dependent methyltransferase [Perspicuibacillus lycopersici]
MGREFDQLFDQWALTYDDTVYGTDEQYKEVFSNYEEILDEVAKLSLGSVLEFGVGTGNLTKRLLNREHKVIGIEPSKEMRKIAKQKLPHLQIMEGDFLAYPKISEPIETIVSTYAFHHLTDEEKQTAIKRYANMLSTGNKIVFADTMFVSDQAKQEMIDQAKINQFHRLAEDLQTEYYTTLPILEEFFQLENFTVHFTKKNPFVWILEAVKK